MSPPHPIRPRITRHIDSGINCRGMNELEIIIELLIAENGGRERYADKIESEWVKLSKGYLKKWTHDEELFILKNYNTKSAVYISEHTKHNLSSVYNKIQKMRERALIQYRKSLIDF